MKTAFHLIMALCWVMLASVHMVIFSFTNSEMFQRVECVVCFAAAILCMIDALWYMKG